MQNDIHKKICTLLAGDAITDEVKTVYLLVQARKLFEHDDTLGKSLPTLKFYCNWALHVQLDQAGAKKFLQTVMPVLTLSGAHAQEAHHDFDALLTLAAFRSELRDLLESFGANLAVCDDPVRWADFLRAYSHVVQDAELILTTTSVPSGPLALAVKKVTIRPTSSGTSTDPTVKIYPMLWFIEYADGRIGRLTLSEHGLLGATVDLFAPIPTATTNAA